MHGFSAFKVLAILAANFTIATQLSRNYIPAATWIFNIGVLFANEISDGYQFARIADHISPEFTHKVLYDLGTWLDGYSGIMSRWHILFNITVLRLISFNLDYYWSLDRRSGSPEEVSIQILIFHVAVLMRTRRSNLILPTCLKEIVSRYLQMPRTTASATMSPMQFMHRST